MSSTSPCQGQDALTRSRGGPSIVTPPSDVFLGNLVDRATAAGSKFLSLSSGQGIVALELLGQDGTHACNGFNTTRVKR